MFDNMLQSDVSLSDSDSEYGQFTDLDSGSSDSDTEIYSAVQNKRATEHTFDLETTLPDNNDCEEEVVVNEHGQNDFVTSITRKLTILKTLIETIESEVNEYVRGRKQN